MTTYYTIEKAKYRFHGNCGHKHPDIRSAVQCGIKKYSAHETLRLYAITGDSVRSCLILGT